MITRRKIEIYKKYGGDYDGIARVGTKTEREIIEADDWSTISSILQDLGLIKKGLCSKEYCDKVYKLLNDRFDIESQELLKGMI